MIATFRVLLGSWVGSIVVVESDFRHSDFRTSDADVVLGHFYKVYNPGSCDPSDLCTTTGSRVISVFRNMAQRQCLLGGK